MNSPFYAMSEKKFSIKKCRSKENQLWSTENTTQILTYKHHFMLCLFSFTWFLSLFFFLKKQAYKLYLVSCPSVSLLSLVLVPFLSTNPPPTFTVCLQNCLKINDQPMFPTISTNHLGADDDNGGGFRAFSGNVYGFCGGFGYWMMMIVAIVFLGFGDVPAHLLSC